MIQIEDVNYYYKKKDPLFQTLNLSLKNGYIHGLLGKNGAGKTTLMKLISGCLFPKKGSISVNNESPMKRQVSFLQNMYFIPEEIVVNNYKQKDFEEKYSFFYPRFDHELFHEMLSRFQVPKNKNLLSISQGERKKFFLSFGLATNCQTLLLDEPTNSLDIPSKSVFRKLISQYIQDNRMIIISTHQVRDVASLIDSIVLLDNGKIVFNQNTETISRKLSVSIHSDNVIPSNSIFHQNSMYGTVSLQENEGIEPCEIDIELLFNAIIQYPNEINDIFRNS